MQRTWLKIRVQWSSGGSKPDDLVETTIGQEAVKNGQFHCSCSEVSSIVEFQGPTFSNLWNIANRLKKALRQVHVFADIYIDDVHEEEFVVKVFYRWDDLRRSMGDLLEKD